jgi:hypothetical protein
VPNHRPTNRQDERAGRHTAAQTQLFPNLRRPLTPPAAVTSAPSSGAYHQGGWVDVSTYSCTAVQKCMLEQVCIGTHHTYEATANNNHAQRHRKAASSTSTPAPFAMHTHRAHDAVFPLSVSQHTPELSVGYLLSVRDPIGVKDTAVCHGPLTTHCLRQEGCRQAAPDHPTQEAVAVAGETTPVQTCRPTQPT